jgi:hypothetical protein
MAPRSRKHLTAWLGIVAMWLIVFAPLVSQLVMSAHPVDPVATVLCSAMQQPSHGVADTLHANPLAACGYCDLLTDHASAPALPPVLPVFVMLAVLAVIPALTVQFAPRGAFPSGRPRDPPVFS